MTHPTISRLMQWLPWLRANLALRDLVVLVGIIAMMHGLRQVYAPLAWIFLGALCLWIAFRRTPA